MPAVLCPSLVFSSMLALGGACTLDDLRQHIASDLHAVLASLDNEGLPGRRAKVEAQVCWWRKGSLTLCVHLYYLC